MAMATTLAGPSFCVGAAVQRSLCSRRQRLQGLTMGNPSCNYGRLKSPVISATSESRTHTDELSQGASAIAGALFAAMATSDSAVAAQQVAALATDDTRGAALLIPLIPALGWVLFNILQPGLNQLNKMKSVKGLAAGVGLGALASLTVSPHADAAVQEIAQMADSDSRGLVLLGILIPAVGWVLYNILRPGLNQLNKMKSTKGLILGFGVGGAASLLATPHADAALEVASIADNDSRGLVLLGILIPAVGWVLYNILQPGLNQLNKMKARGLIGTVGLASAMAYLLAPPNSDAAQEISQLAADDRPLILLVILIPAIGWVLFNILRPALNQLNKMKGGK